MRAAQEKNLRAKAFLSQRSLPGAEVLSPTIRKPQRPLFENAAASDGGSCEMMLIQAARKASPDQRPSNAVNRAGETPSSRVMTGVSFPGRLPPSPIFRQHADATLLISTFAPGSIFFHRRLALVAFLDRLGAPSTALSLPPGQGPAPPAPSLITPILLVPISFKITSKVVFSSAAGAAAPPPPAAGAAAIATGAAALTPHFSSSCFTNPAISRTVSPLSCSTILSVSAIVFSSVRRFRKPSEN